MIEINIDNHNINKYLFEVTFREIGEKPYNEYYLTNDRDGFRKYISDIARNSDKSLLQVNELQKNLKTINISDSNGQGTII